MKVIGFCGEIGSGKDAAAQYLIDNKGYKKVVMSNIIIEELRKNNIEVNRKNLQNFSKEYKEKHGKGIWAVKCAEYAKAQGWSKAIISGLRDTEEVKKFRELLQNDFTLIYVKTDKEIRYSRLLQRNSEKDPKNNEELEEQEKREKEIFDLYSVFEEYADQSIINNTTLEDLFKQVESLVS